jgi:hypothetical protein
MRSQRGYLALCLLLFSSLADATIYKWQDANGEVHYGQTPPTDADATLIKPHVAPSSSAAQEQNDVKQLEKKFQTEQEKQLAAQEKAKKDAENEKARAQNCEEAKTHLAYLEPRVRVRMQDASGQVIQLTEAQRNDEVKKTQEAVEKYCSPAKPGQ